MDEIFGIILFLLIVLGSALESLWKARKKKRQSGAGRAPGAAKPRPRPAAKRPTPAPGRAGATRPAPGRAPAAGPRARRPTPEPAAPTDVVEMIQRRLEELARGEEAGVAVEEEGAEALPLPEGYSLEEIPPQEPAERRAWREEAMARREREPALGPPIRAHELSGPAQIQRRRGAELPALTHLSAVQRAFVWAEIIGRPAAEREEGPSAPPGIRG